MPHQCTTCDRRFADGSKEMLSGCPGCGGNTFQYLPEGRDPPAEADPPERPDVGGGAVAETVGRATTTLRDLVAGGKPTGGDWPDGADAALVDGEEPEDLAQSSARSEMVTREELPDGSEDRPIAVGSARGIASPSDGSDPGRPREDGIEQEAGEMTPDGDEGGDDVPPSEGRVVSEPTDRMPDIEELRAELNDQFEGIRIVEPGQYELNLMELYEREETIVALRENGRYVIEVPEAWHGDERV